MSSPQIPSNLPPYVRDAIHSAAAARKPPSSANTYDVSHPQSYFSFSPETSNWIPVTSKLSHTPATTHLILLSWNIDFMLPFASSRMSTAINHLQSISSPSPDQPPEHPTVILLQEMTSTDLSILTTHPWIRSTFHLTDISTTEWGNGFYGTVTLIDRRLRVKDVFRVHYSASRFERDGLFVDVSVAGPAHHPDRLLRICNTHLESLVADPPLRPAQLHLVAQYLHDPTVHAAILAGDLNAIQPFDRTLHADNHLHDAYLALGGREDDDAAYTWGQQAPVTERERYGCSRMDKVLFTGGVACVGLERVGRGVEVESEAERMQMVSLCGVEGGWVSDHLGVKAEFNIVDRDDHETK